MYLKQLKRRSEEVQHDIEELERTIQPFQYELRRKKEALDHLQSLVRFESGEAPGSSLLHDGPSQIAQFSGKKGDWKHICREHGWTVGADSAHRVVMRQDPQLHADILHVCPYI